MKKSQTPRFEVELKQRLEQKRTATDAVRLPRLGYKQYRVYDIEEVKDKNTINGLYGQHVGRGIRKGPMPVTLGSSLHWTKKLQIFIDELEFKVEPKFIVKWLKPKAATLLRLQGRRVEEVV